MPKVDGVTRCLARLLAHLREQGHEAVVLGPQSGMVILIEDRHKRLSLHRTDSL